MKPRRELVIAGALFFLSGAVGLIYEIVWIKIFSLQLGSSAWAISTVICSFMAGLGIGSWWAGRQTDHWPRPLRIYGYIEWGIAAVGFFSLFFLKHIDAVVAPLYPLSQHHFAWFMFFQVVLVFLLLLIPTALMGASLPVLVVGLSRYESFESVIGFLYGINTAGAAAGVALAGFYLLPFLGVRATIIAACVMGFAVGGAAIFWDRNRPASDASEAGPQELGDRSSTPRAFLLASFMSGALSIFYEISWTRLLTPVFGSSTYAFSIILITFLLGIGLGGVAAGLSVFRRFRYLSGVSILIFLNSLSVGAGVFLVNLLPDIFLAMAARCREQLWLFFLGQIIISAWLILVPTFLMGAALPLAVMGASVGNKKGTAVGKVYLSNTLGSILGSLLAGFVVLPWCGAPGSILTAAGAGLLTAFFLARTDKQLSKFRKNVWTVSLVFVFALFFLASPVVNLRRLHSGVFRHALSKEALKEPLAMDLIFIKEGYNCTVSVYRTPDDTILKVGGKTDASMAGDLPTQYLLGHLPMFASARPEAVCVIGLGSGATVRAVAAHPVKSIDIVELEPAVVQACQLFTPVNNKILSDERVHLHLEDGRTFLKYHEKKFDVIISEPSNPWVAGVSNLFSAEYYQLVKNRMPPNGVFCQWIQFYELSTPTFNMMLNTLGDHFSHVVFLVHLGDLICLASDQPIHIPTQVEFRDRFSTPDIKKTLSDIGIENKFDLFLGYFASFPEDRAVYEAGERNTDDNLRLEFRAPIEMYRNARPDIKPRPAGELLDRYERLFYPELPRDQVALGLAKAFVKLRPYLAYRIREFIPLARNKESAASLSRLTVEAEVKYAQSQRQQQLVDEGLNAFDSEKSPQQAVEIFQQATKIPAKSGAAWRGLGQAYLFMDNYNASLKSFEQAYQMNSNDYVSMTGIGISCLYKKDFQKAHQFLAMALKSNPTFPQAWAHMFVFLSRTARFDEAATVYKDIQRQFPGPGRAKMDRMIKQVSLQEPYLTYLPPAKG